MYKNYFPSGQICIIRFVVIAHEKTKLLINKRVVSNFPKAISILRRNNKRLVLFNFKLFFIPYNALISYAIAIHFFFPKLFPYSIVKKNEKWKDFNI